MTDHDVSYLLVDGTKFIGIPPNKDAIKRMSQLYEADTGRKPRVYVNIAGKISEMGDV
jgi:hypothetical protein